MAIRTNLPGRPLISVPGHDLRIQVTDDGSRTLIDPRTGVAYHSASGAVAETDLVYLINSGVRDRLIAGSPPRLGCSPADSAAPESDVRTPCGTTSILEIGLGTGLALLMSLDLAITHHHPLRYTAIEENWLAPDLIAELQLDRHVTTVGLVDGFLNWRRSLGESVPPGIWEWKPAEGCQVTVYHGDAQPWADGAEPIATYDAIYFDPFAPNENPQLWEPRFLQRMAALLYPGGRLVTYCVNRNVREAMESAGFRVARVTGPKGGKREVMIATKPPADQASTASLDH